MEMKSFFLVLAMFLILEGENFLSAQPVDDSTISLTPLKISEAAITSVTSQPVLLEVKTEISVQNPEIGKTFEYLVKISFQGNPGLISLETPTIRWPDGVRQVDVSTGVRSFVGLTGPMGEKFFRYTLLAEKEGTMKIPSFKIMYRQEEQQPSSVEAPSISFQVSPVVIPIQNQIIALIKENLVIVTGLLLMILVGLVVGWRLRGQRSVPSQQEDVWAFLVEDLRKAEALRDAGLGRDLYGLIELSLRKAGNILMGKEVRNLADLENILYLNAEQENSFHHLLSQVEEHKFSPSPIHSDQIHQAFRQYKQLIEVIRQSSEKRVKG